MESGFNSTNHLVHESIHEASQKQRKDKTDLTTRESKVVFEQEMA